MLRSPLEALIKITHECKFMALRSDTLTLDSVEFRTFLQLRMLLHHIKLSAIQGRFLMKIMQTCEFRILTFWLRNTLTTWPCKSTYQVVFDTTPTFLNNKSNTIHSSIKFKSTKTFKGSSPLQKENPDTTAQHAAGSIKCRRDSEKCHKEKIPICPFSRTKQEQKKKYKKRDERSKQHERNQTSRMHLVLDLYFFSSPHSLPYGPSRWLPSHCNGCKQWAPLVQRSHRIITRLVGAASKLRSLHEFSKQHHSKSLQTPFVQMTFRAPTVQIPHGLKHAFETSLCAAGDSDQSTRRDKILTASLNKY